MTPPRFPPEGDLPPFTPLGFMRGDAIIRTFGWEDDGGPVDLTGARIVFRIATTPPTTLTSDAQGGIVILPQAGPSFFTPADGYLEEVWLFPGCDGASPIIKNALRAYCLERHPSMTIALVT